MNELFEKASQLAILTNETRFKILVALFNSDFATYDGKKIGAHSHTLEELSVILGILDLKVLSYHIKMMLDLNLVEQPKDNPNYFHITDSGKYILNEFGINESAVQKAVKNLS